jgi:cyanophycin synthetase
MTAERLLELAPAEIRPSDFEDWRARLDRERVSPVIAVAGSRGKTSVLRALESILKIGGYRVATWTNRGVELEGQGQRGELEPWSRALTRLHAGGLDVALRELDWATMQTIGSPEFAYPVLAVTNLCANSDACLATQETLLARKGLARIHTNIAPTGRLILNADDFAVAEELVVEPTGRYVMGINPDTPVLRRHLKQGGDACWVDGASIVVSEERQTTQIIDLARLSWAHDGDIPFAVQNALLVTAIARSIGLSPDLIASGLVAHDPRPEIMPGSFNVFEIGASTVVIDRPMPSWFLRTSLRATANLGRGRQIRIVGPMAEIASDDLSEVGRLLGRSSGVIVVHGAWHPERMSLFRHGAAANDVPPLFVQAADERSAVQQGLDLLRPNDVMLILAEQPQTIVRLVANQQRRRSGATRESVGAA